MTTITPTFDPSGNLSDSDLMQQDISNLMDKVNDLDSQNGITRSVNGTDFYYDKTGVNYMQIGILPDSTNGVAYLDKNAKIVSENNGYQNYIYDNTGVPRILIGQSPDDGRIGIWISKPGQSVKTLLGG